MSLEELSPGTGKCRHKLTDLAVISFLASASATIGHYGQKQWQCGGAQCLLLSVSQSVCLPVCERLPRSQRLACISPHLPVLSADHDGVSNFEAAALNNQSCLRACSGVAGFYHHSSRWTFTRGLCEPNTKPLRLWQWPQQRM